MRSKGWPVSPWRPFYGDAAPLNSPGRHGRFFLSRAQRRLSILKGKLARDASHGARATRRRSPWKSQPRIAAQGEPWSTRHRHCSVRIFWLGFAVTCWPCAGRSPGSTPLWREVNGCGRRPAAVPSQTPTRDRASLQDWTARAAVKGPWNAWSNWCRCGCATTICTLWWMRDCSSPPMSAIEVGSGRPCGRRSMTGAAKAGRRAARGVGCRGHFPAASGRPMPGQSAISRRGTSSTSTGFAPP